MLGGGGGGGGMMVVAGVVRGISSRLTSSSASFSGWTSVFVSPASSSDIGSKFGSSACCTCYAGGPPVGTIGTSCYAC